MKLVAKYIKMRTNTVFKMSCPMFHNYSSVFKRIGSTRNCFFHTIYALCNANWLFALLHFTKMKRAASTASTSSLSSGNSKTRSAIKYRFCVLRTKMISTPNSIAALSPQLPYADGLLSHSHSDNR